jgi:hypothetical protein
MWRNVMAKAYQYGNRLAAAWRLKASLGWRRRNNIVISWHENNIAGSFLALKAKPRWQRNINDLAWRK